MERTKQWPGHSRDAAQIEFEVEIKFPGRRRRATAIATQEIGGCLKIVSIVYPPDAPTGSTMAGLVTREKGRDGVTRKRVTSVEFVECDCVEASRCAYNCACRCHTNRGRSVVQPLTERRARVDLFTPAETAIREAMLAVEDVGAHPLLTEAVTLLDEAQEVLGAYVTMTMEPKSEAGS